MVQLIFFLTRIINMFAGKFVEWGVRFLAVSWEWVKVRKMSEVFEANYVVKWVIFFARFCWLWGFLPENLKFIDKSQIWGFESFILRSKFCFLGLFQSVLASIISIFFLYINHGGRHFCSAQFSTLSNLNLRRIIKIHWNATPVFND